MRPIEEVLNGRADLSAFVVHLTRQDPQDAAKKAIENLNSMLFYGVIEARSPHGWAKGLAVAGDSQKAVCFSETPLQHITSLTDIAGRQVNLEPIGLAFTRVVARGKGALPVWYVDNRSPQYDALDELVTAALAGEFTDHPAAKLFPFYEGMGKGQGWRKEFWWEREWRHVGDFSFDRASELALIVAPEQWHPWLGKTYPERPCIDAKWSLERMIASIAGLDPSSVSSFS